MTDELDELWRHVRHIAQARVDLVARAAGDLRRREGAGPGGDSCLTAPAVEECHKLVGSLGSYGRASGSVLALRVAELLGSRDPDLDALDEAVAGLQTAVAS